MPGPPEIRPTRRPAQGDRRGLGPVSLGLTGLIAVVAGMLFVLLFRSAPTLAAQQTGAGELASAPATENPMGAPSSLPTATTSTLLTPTATSTSSPTATASLLLTATATSTTLPTPTASSTSSPIATPSALLTPTATSTTLPTPTATPGALATPTADLISGGTATPTLVGGPVMPVLPQARNDTVASEGLWGIAQTCTAPLYDAGNSIDLAFNDATASCGSLGDGSTWTYVEMQDTTLLTVVEAVLEVRFYVSGWTNDPIDLEAGNGFTWWTVATFGPGSLPPAALTTLSYDLSTVFTTPAEANGAQVRFVGGQLAGLDGYFLHLDEARLVVSDDVPTATPQPTLDPIPTPTAPVPSPTEPPIVGDPHVEYSATTASCAGCHRAHTSQGIVLRQDWPEESLCFACHTSSGPGTDVEAAFGYANTATGIFQHDVASANSVHHVGEAEGTAFGGEDRHVECEDCHEPHEATRGPAGAPMSQREMNEVPGVDPVWTAAGAPGGYVWLPRAEREYQACFKCHSSFTSLPTYIPDGWDGSSHVPDGLRKLTYGGSQQVPDSRDMAQEFNPYNASFHPVIAQGRNQAMVAGSFVPGWSSASMVYCTDCHSNPYASAEGSGPHGSPLLHLLNGLADYQTTDHDEAVYVGTEVCFNCHDPADYTGNGSDSNFRRASRNLHGQHRENGSCYLCHDSHGSEQLHLLNLDLSIEDGWSTYLLPGYDGLPTNSQTYWQISPDGLEKTCWLVCHGHDHGISSYPNLSD